MKLQNKVVVITGAGGGLGRQLTIQLLKRGASVAAVDINKDELEKTRFEAGIYASKISIHVADITNPERVSDLPDEVVAHHKKVDALINNAGIIQPFITMMDLDYTSIQRIMNINFYGMLNMTRAFIPFLAERPEAYVANVSSMGGFLPVPGQALYGASKAAVKIATEGLRMELSKTNIGVSLVLPGGIETDIKKNSGLRDAEISEEDKKSAGIKLTKPEAAAELILKGIERNKAKILIGTDSKIMDLLYRLAPLKAGKMISKVMADNHGGILSESVALMAKRRSA